MNDKLFLFDDLITELSEDASPGHLDQLELFYKDTEELFGSMTSIITSSQLAVTCSSLHPELAQPLAAGEPAGHLLQWPSPRCGLTSVIRSDQQGQCNSLIAVFPFIGDGVKHRCRLLETRLYANRLEAQLFAYIGGDEELNMTFYDAHYLANRTIYQKEALYHFILRGFAYHLESVMPGPDGFMEAIYQREELGADHYEISGLVRDVKEYDFAMPEQKFWLLRTLIARTSSGEEIEIDLLLTGKTLGKNSLPQAGDCINALIWLQGHLWGPTES
ncbi:MAG: hypothetical protein CVV41_03545 [Candidatus Riflebacteria bacterium HGW-Riflebacteria-1]|jgi:hypothetical protein|nr:MAG: hypothetical protein CVV41_03545 [Candidatus Riflebacteria bacterium HGW-Riflebacteria-1]